MINEKNNVADTFWEIFSKQDVNKITEFQKYMDKFVVNFNLYKDGNFMYQNHFDFLKTDNGFKLIGLTIRDGRLN